MDHKTLCSLAVNWLKRPASRIGPGCLIAISESANWINREIPDAIGWRPYGYGCSGSVLIEAKVSRADFLADFKKPHRLEPSHGMGTYRYFLAPEGIVSIDELPHKWGLVEVNARGHLKVRAGHVMLRHGEVDHWRHEFNHAAEIGTLAMCLNRVGDPQLFQERLRETGNRAVRMQNQLELLREKNRKLAVELMRLKCPEESTGCAVRNAGL